MKSVGLALVLLSTATCVADLVRTDQGGLQHRQAGFPRSGERYPPCRNDSGAAPLDRRPVFRGETGVGFGFATFEKWYVDSVTISPRDRRDQLSV